MTDELDRIIKAKIAATEPAWPEGEADPDVIAQVPFDEPMMGFIYFALQDAIIYHPIVDWDIRRDEGNQPYAVPIFACKEIDEHMSISGMVFKNLFFCRDGIFTSMRDWAITMMDSEVMRQHGPRPDDTTH